jgi:hypothetical protein
LRRFPEGNFAPVSWPNFLCPPGAFGHEISVGLPARPEDVKSGLLSVNAVSPIALGSYWHFFSCRCSSPPPSRREHFLLANLPGYAASWQKVCFHLIPFLW